jgi:hypothetical protein
MRQRPDTDKHASPVDGQQAVRKPYRKPAVRHERVFETNAMVCGKTTTQGSCTHSRKTS